MNLRGFDPRHPPADPAAALDALLRQLGMPGQKIPQTLDERAAMFRDRIHGRDAILLLDNAADAHQVRDLLPATPTCFVVITSRRSLADLEGATRTVPEVFRPEEALRLLAAVAGEARISAEPEAAEQIVRATGGLPLAVSIAAARLKSRPAWPLSELARRLEAGLGAVVSAERSLEAIFDLSYRDLSSQAGRLFRLLGRHPGNDFTRDSAAALAGLEQASVEALLERLQDENLVYQNSGGRYEMHDLLRQHARQRGLADDPELGAAARRRLIDHYLHTSHQAAMIQVPIRDPIPIPLSPSATAAVPIRDATAADEWFDAEFEVLYELISDCAESEPVTAWQLAWSLVGHCMKAARSKELESGQTVALKAAERMGNLTAAVYSLQTRALAKDALHDFSGAIADLERSVRICQNIGDRFYEARGLSNIAAAKATLEDYASCLVFARRALDVVRSLGAESRSEQARSLNLIGWSLAHLGDLDQAVEASEESLRLAEKIEDLWMQGVALDSLAFAHRARGAYGESAATYRRALAIHARNGAALFRARTLVHLGDLQQGTGDSESALASFQEALQTFDTADEQAAEDARRRIAELS